MIVEDEMIIARDLEAILGSMGHTIVGIANNANDAMILAGSHDVDVALLDIGIKGDRDGITLAAHLREEFPMKIVFLTSHADSDSVKRASAINADGYILKPFSKETIYTSLSVIIANQTPTSKSADLERLSEESSGWTRLPASITEEIEKYVARHLDREITLADMAEIAGMSESAFTRRFKETSGSTPYQYVLNERLAESKRLLRDTDWQLVDIAASVGFSSQSHFTTTFKKHVGVTPLSYRRL